jgi:hypothetical protein
MQITSLIRSPDVKRQIVYNCLNPWNSLKKVFVHTLHECAVHHVANMDTISEDGQL